MVSLRSDVVRAPTDYGCVLLHMDDGRYWTLNPTGDLVLRVLLEGGDTAAAVREVCRGSEVDPETAAADVEGLLDQLADVGLIDPDGAGAQPDAQPDDRSDHPSNHSFDQPSNDPPTKGVS